MWLYLCAICVSVGHLNYVAFSSFHLSIVPVISGMSASAHKRLIATAALYTGTRIADLFQDFELNGGNRKA